MHVKVELMLTRDEADRYRKEWKEYNSGDITDEEIKEAHLEMFWADKHEYLCSADIECYIVDSMKDFITNSIKELW